MFTHLSIRTSLEGSIDARRDEGSEPPMPDGRRSDGLRDAGFEAILQILWVCSKWKSEPQRAMLNDELDVADDDDEQRW